MIGYIFALLPLYMLVYLPITHVLQGKQPQSTTIDFSSLNTSFLALDEPLQCATHSYTTHILSLEPLMIYIEKFLSEEESAHLLNISEDKYASSTISQGGETSIDPSVRRSEVAILDRDDIVRCIEHRARSFQGWMPNIRIERLRTQRYTAGGHYSHHFDWSGAGRGGGGDRVTTFMVYVDVSEGIEGGGTEFSRLKGLGKERGGRWCEFMDCEDEVNEGRVKGEGITFKPVKGNAVLWVNVRPDGRGYEETWHAGLPVLKGEKVGLNIWSWGSAKR